MTRRVLITGSTGQDGAYLAEHLLADGCEICCGFRRSGSHKIWRLETLGILERVTMTPLEVTEFQNVLKVVQTTKPDVIFHLAAQSFVLDSHEYPTLTTNVNVIGTLNLLEVLRIVSPHTKLFFASTSELFGVISNAKIDEDTPFNPRNPYSISKLHAHLLVRNYREMYGMKCSSGILFNHESPLRGREFVSRKITFNMARLRVEGGHPVALGNLNAIRDWGAAKDYTHAMNLMTLQDAPEDYVIASGVETTVKEFLKKAAACAGFDLVFDGRGLNEVGIDRTSGKTLVVISKDYFRVNDSNVVVGDPTRLKTATGWAPAVTLDALIEEMVIADIRRWEQGNINV